MDKGGKYGLGDRVGAPIVPKRETWTVAPIRRTITVLNTNVLRPLAFKMIYGRINDF